MIQNIQRVLQIRSIDPRLLLHAFSNINAYQDATAEQNLKNKAENGV